MYPFNDDRVFVQSAWYVAAWSREVTTGGVLDRRILDTPLVFYRTTAGEAVALHGVCPHKFHPLGTAALVDDQLVCPYHGFEFASDGRCTRIPSQEHVPKRCAIRSYPVAERWKWLWVWMGDPQLADPALIPDHEQIGLTDSWDPREGTCLQIDARYQILNDNLLDLTHIGFLHAARATPEYAEGMGGKAPELHVDEQRRCQTNTHVLRMKHYHSPVPGVDELDEVDVALSIDFYPPGFHVGRLRFLDPADDGSVRHVGELRMFHAMTPITRHSTYYFFANARDYQAPAGAVDLLVRNQVGILDDDKAAAEAIERILTTTDVPKEFVSVADAGIIHARRWIQRMIDAESTSSTTSSDARQLSTHGATND